MSQEDFEIYELWDTFFKVFREVSLQTSHSLPSGDHFPN